MNAMSGYLNGGAWTAEDHARHPSFDAPLAAAIAAPLLSWRGVVVADVGGGPGRYVAQLAAGGAVCTVYEPEPQAVPPGVWQAHMDLTAGVWVIHGSERARLVLCLEVMEHIPRHHHDMAFDNLCALMAPRGILVFSGATPGQGGQGHVAERPEWEWRMELARRGLVADNAGTTRLRQAATLPWFKANVMVWGR